MRFVFLMQTLVSSEHNPPSCSYIAYKQRNNVESIAFGEATRNELDVRCNLGKQLTVLCEHTLAPMLLFIFTIEMMNGKKTKNKKDEQKERSKEKRQKKKRRRQKMSQK